MKLFKKSSKKSSVVDDVQKNMDRASSHSIGCASWYKQAFETSSKQDLEWDENKDTLKSLDDIHTEEEIIRIHS